MFESLFNRGWKSEGETKSMLRANGYLLGGLSEYKVLDGHDEAVLTAEFSPDGSRLLTGGEDQIFRVHEIPSGKLISEDHSAQPEAAIRHALFKQGGGSTILHCLDNQVMVSDLKYGSCSARMLGCHRGDAAQLALHPEYNDCFYSCGLDGLVVFYDLRCSGPQSVTVCRSIKGLPKLSHNCSIQCNPVRPWQFLTAPGDCAVKIFDHRMASCQPVPKQASSQSQRLSIMPAKPVRYLIPESQKLSVGGETVTSRYVERAIFTQIGEVLALQTDGEILKYRAERNISPTSPRGIKGILTSKKHGLRKDLSKARCTGSDAQSSPMRFKSELARRGAPANVQETAEEESDETPGLEVDKNKRTLRAENEVGKAEGSHLDRSMQSIIAEESKTSRGPPVYLTKAGESSLHARPSSLDDLERFQGLLSCIFQPANEGLKEMTRVVDGSLYPQLTLSERMHWAEDQMREVEEELMQIHRTFANCACKLQWERERLVMHGCGPRTEHQRKRVHFESKGTCDPRVQLGQAMRDQTLPQNSSSRSIPSAERASTDQLSRKGNESPSAQDLGQKVIPGSYQPIEGFLLSSLQTVLGNLEGHAGSIHSIKEICKIFWQQGEDLESLFGEVAEQALETKACAQLARETTRGALQGLTNGSATSALLSDGYSDSDSDSDIDFHEFWALQEDGTEIIAECLRSADTTLGCMRFENETVQIYKQDPVVGSGRAISSLGLRDDYVMATDSLGHIRIWQSWDGKSVKVMLSSGSNPLVLSRHPLNPLSFVAAGVGGQLALHGDF